MESSKDEEEKRIRQMEDNKLDAATSGLFSGEVAVLVQYKERSGVANHGTGVGARQHQNRRRFAASYGLDRMAKSCHITSRNAKHQLQQEDARRSSEHQYSKIQHAPAKLYLPRYS